MKNLNLIIVSTVLAFSIVFSGCKKKDEDPAPIIPATPACTNVISQEVEIYNDGVNPTSTTTKVYTYNASKKLIKITAAYGSNPVSEFDTIAYNANGEIITVERYSVGSGTPFETNIYTYTSGRITAVHEVGNNGSPYDRIRTLAYNVSGQLTDQTVAYTVGAGSGGPENFTSLTYTGANITGGTVSPYGAVTIVYDLTAVNPYLGLNNDMEDLLTFSYNNPTSAYANVAPGSPLFTHTYTYANGRVSTITDGFTITTITYACI